MAIKMFVRARLRFMAALKEEKGPPGHIIKQTSGKEIKVGQQGKLVNFDRLDVNSTSEEYLYVEPSLFAGQPVVPASRGSRTVADR